MLLSDFIKTNTRALATLYPEDEARSIVMYYCAETFGMPGYIHVTEPSTEVPADLLDGALSDMERLKNAEPIQYVLGYTEFCCRNFKVDERVLIPRAETEVLCMKAEEMAKALVSPSAGETMGGRPLRILDLCTGSGCIAWTLALDLPGSIVTATDISSEALDLARSQFSRIRKPAVKPTFIQADVLDTASGLPQCDLLTANPPYVMAGEKAEMRPNVLNFEPHLAIFAPEQDPLVFHRAIAVTAMNILVGGGKGIVEINSELEKETSAVFTDAGLADVHTVQDFFERPRFIAFTRP